MGGGQQAKYIFKNGKYCYSKSFLSCVNIRKKEIVKLKRKTAEKVLKRPPFSKEWKYNLSISDHSIFNSIEFLNKNDKKIIEYFGSWLVVYQENVTGKTLEENIIERIEFFKNKGY